jgi:hypothetical protein
MRQSRPRLIKHAQASKHAATAASSTQDDDDDDDDDADGGGGGDNNDARLEHRVKLLHFLGAVDDTEALEELRGVLEVGRVDEAEERPQLLRVILQRRASQKQARLARERRQLHRQLGAPVLQSVRLVDHHTLPGHLAQRAGVVGGHLVRRHAHGEAVR